jgi:hypothetical protein
LAKPDQIPRVLQIAAQLAGQLTNNASQGIVRALPWLMIDGWFVVIACASSSLVTPNPITGHIVPMNNHGTIHYVTPLVHYLIFL